MKRCVLDANTSSSKKIREKTSIGTGDKRHKERQLVQALKLGLITWFEYFDAYKKLE